MDLSDLSVRIAGFWVLVALAGIWEAVWKGFALWRAARNRHLAWFIALLVLNTLGILPIVYLIFFSKRRGPSAQAPPA